MLRASGVLFDVDRFINDCALDPVSVWHKGELRFPNSKTDEARLAASGVSFEVSDADFSELDVQFAEAEIWLAENRAEVARLVAFNGVDVVAVDFGAEIRPPGWSTFTFPPSLTALVGGLGLKLKISVYPTTDEPKT